MRYRNAANNAAANYNLLNRKCKKKSLSSQTPK